MNFNDGFLRLALRIDALASGAVGVGCLALSQVLDGPLGTPASHSLPIGAFLIAFAAVILFIASRPKVSGPAVMAVIAFNVLWIVDSVAYAVLAGSLTGLGVAFTLAQAAAVALFADLEFLGLRKMRNTEVPMGVAGNAA